jgi:predicted nucleotidyltransferase
VPTLPDQTFLDTTADRLAALPAVRAVTLGGSRAQGTERPDSDWDLAIYTGAPSTRTTSVRSAGRARSPNSARGAAASSTAAPG